MSQEFELRLAKYIAYQERWNQILLERIYEIGELTSDEINILESVKEKLSQMGEKVKNIN